MPSSHLNHFKRSFRPFHGLMSVTSIYLISVAVVVAQGARPIVDEWIYVDAARQFAATGQIDIAPISFAVAIFEAIFGGFVLLVTDGGLPALVMATAALAAIAGLSLWDLLTRSGVRPSFAMFAVGVFLFSTVFYGLSTTYMTDAHAVSLILIAAALLSRGIDGDEPSRFWLLAGGVVVAAAYLSRPGAIAVLAGVTITAVRRNQWHALSWALMVPSVTVIAHLLGPRLGFLPPIRSDLLDRIGIPSWPTWIGVAVTMAILIGLWVVPLMPAVAHSLQRSGDRRHTRSFLLFTGTALLALLALGGPPLIGNWLSRKGMFPIESSVVGLRLIVLDWFPFLVACIASLLITAAVIVFLARTPSSQLQSVGIGLWSAAMLSVGLVLVTQVASWGVILDRYLVVFLPAILFSIPVRVPSRLPVPIHLAGVAGLAVVSALSFVMAVDGMRLQNAVFTAAESGVSQGIAVAEIDGGAAWTGFNFGLDMRPEDTVATDPRHWWRGRFAPGIDPQYVVTLNPEAEACAIYTIDVEALIGPDNQVALVDTAC